MRLGHDLLISVIDRGISPFRRILFSRNFAYAKFRENKTLAKNSEFTVNQKKEDWKSLFSSLFCLKGEIVLV